MPRSEIDINHAPPSPGELVWLRTISGLTPPPSSADIAKALAASIHCITARAPLPSTTPLNGVKSDLPIPPPGVKSMLVGMVRLLGDGVLFCQITDMAVHPDFQGQGLGKKLLDEMLAWIDENAPDAYVSLIGDPPGQALYKSRGFRPTLGMGMTRSSWGK